MKKSAGLISLWLVALLLGTGLSRWKDSKVTDVTNPVLSSHDALIGFVGEFRTVLARYLWFKVELYHEMAEEDGGKSDPEVVPLMRLVTLLDPSMIESYDQIAWDLLKAFKDPDTATSILEEGLARNPSSYQLNFRRAFLAYSTKDNETARRYAATALGLTQDRFELLDCLRLIYWSSKADNLKEIQRRSLEDLLRLSPGDPSYTRELEQLNADEKAASGRSPRK